MELKRLHTEQHLLLGSAPRLRAMEHQHRVMERQPKAMDSPCLKIRMPSTSSLGR